jgi:uncharacterized protein YdhG (YjbR/CyaY superfamily)
MAGRAGKADRAGKPSRRDARAQIADYLAAQPPETRKALKAMRHAIRAAAPGAEEIFSYRIPGFRLRGKPLVWYGGFKNHTSLYPMGDEIRRQFADALRDCETSTGTIRFRIARQPSAALVRKLVSARIAQLKNEG